LTEEHDYTILKNRFNTRYSKIAELARENIQTSSKVVWMCDLDYYIKGKIGGAYGFP
jgi:hypothetical protein